MEKSFLPTTRGELLQRGWQQLDVILVTGDSYIDSPFIGAAVIGRVLEKSGFKVGIIAQPDITKLDDISRLGEPRLFWGVTGGSVDSLVANYTASKKKRKNDDFTPGGINNRRPDRAVITYTNIIRRYFKSTRPIVLGGIEASLRRIPHYDFWSDSVRRSILFDAKADFILYGLAEQSIVDFTRTLQDGKDVNQLRGLSYIAKSPPAEYLELPSYETVAADKLAFIQMFHTFYHNNDPLTAQGLFQGHGDRFLVQNPPAFYPDQPTLDDVYNLPYQRKQHPYYEQFGAVKALETIQSSVSTHRGCYGECNFCAIAVHEGRTVRWRSPESIANEIEIIAGMPDFKGYIQDAGGPTANMYGFECSKKLKLGACEAKRCLYPEVCPALKTNHQAQIDLLKQIRKIPTVKKVFVSSGIRYDLILADKQAGKNYLKEIVLNHVSGQMKIAPEHTEEKILAKMGKPNQDKLLLFKKMFDDLSHETNKEQYLTYYLIAAHPGCNEIDMAHLKRFASQELHISPEQVQIFTPTPSTYSTLMYYTGLDPFTLEPIFVERNLAGKERQKQIVVEKSAFRSTYSSRPHQTR